MNIRLVIQREERKLEKQVARFQLRLESLRAAAKALGNPTGKEAGQIKKRVLSASARAKIAKAAKKRWAKFRAQAKKVTG